MQTPLSPSAQDSPDPRPPVARKERRNARLEALVALLPEDAPTVRSALEAEGKAAVPALRRAARAGEAELRGRARALLVERERRRAARRLAGFLRNLGGAQRGAGLERGLWLIDRFLEPGVDLRPARQQLANWSEELVTRFAGRRPGAQRVLALIDLLGSGEGLAGPREDYHHPHHVSLSRTIERRVGLPLTLCAVYASVARRAGMSAALLPFPGQVLLAVSDGDERLIVDAASGGRLLTIRQCEAHLTSLGLPYRERWLQPANDLDLLRRHGRNLAHAFASGGHIQRARASELRLVEEAFGFDREWVTGEGRETR